MIDFEKHILTSGALNILTGRMENAVLREFTRYDRMWETWLEEDTIEVDYPSTILRLVAHTNKNLTLAQLAFPNWMTASLSKLEPTSTIVELFIQENTSGAERTADVKIDSAIVLITQFSYGDYGIDYGKDYS